MCASHADKQWLPYPVKRGGFSRGFLNTTATPNEKLNCVTRWKCGRWSFIARMFFESTWLRKPKPKIQHPTTYLHIYPPIP